MNALGWLSLILSAVVAKVYWSREPGPPWFRFHARLAVVLVVLAALYEVGRLVPMLRPLPLYAVNVQYGLFIADFLRAILLAVGFQWLFLRGSAGADDTTWNLGWQRIRWVLMAGTVTLPLLLPAVYGPLCPVVERVVPYAAGRHRTIEFLRDFCTPLALRGWLLAAGFAVLQAVWLWTLRGQVLRVSRVALGVMLAVLTAHGTFFVANTNFLRGLPFAEAVERTAEAKWFAGEPRIDRYLVECVPGDQRNNSFHSLCGDVLWIVDRRQLGGLQALAPRRYMQALRAFGGNDPNFSLALAFVGPVDEYRYDWLSYDHLLAYRPLERRAAEFELVLRGDRYYVYRPRDPLPRFLLYDRFVIEPDAAVRIRWLATRRPRSGEPAILDAAEIGARAAAHVRHGPVPPALTYRILLEDDGEVRVRVDADRNGILVFNANHYPGWHADVDGKRVDVFYVNHFMRGLLLEAGQHVVTYRFESVPIRLGSWVSAAASTWL